MAWVKSSVQTGGLLTRCSTLFACFITEIDGYAISLAGANHALAFLMPKRKETEEEAMAVFRVEKTKDYTIMSNHHLKDRRLSLKAKGLLSMMLSLPKEWDYTLKGLARISREGVDAIREAVRELEQAGYVVRSRTSSTNIPCPHPEARRSLRGRNLYWKIQRRRNLHRKIPHN